jgi:tellurite resistance protein
MTIDPIRRRPKAFPPPEFPPRKPKLFARTPPAVFPVLLGLIGLALALRRGLAGFGLAEGLVEALVGALVVGWAFALLALAAKIARRPGVLIEDLRVLPGRSGMAAATVSVMAMASLVLPYAPGLTLALLWAGLVLHALLTVVLIRVLIALPPEARGVNPGMHLSFVGFIVAAVPAAQIGQTGLATGLLWATLPVAALIWGISLAQLIRRIPPAPLRPMLAIHLAPAALFATVAGMVGQPVLAQAFAAFGAVILLALIAASRWITSAGFSPLWGAFGFPLAAYASALLTLGGAWGIAGNLVLGAAFLIIPPISWLVLKLWPAGRLAAKTNAAEA